MKKTVNGKTILTLSKGNKKLVGDENNAFLIWNLPAIATCPYATEQCKKYCYAMKAERLYTNTKNSRAEQFADSKCGNFIQDMINTINYYINLKSIKGKIVYFRIHESGDFYNQEYFDKWVKIASEFPEVNFLAYTKSVKYLNETKLSIPTNLVIRFSIWDDTKQEQKEIANKLQLPIYTAFTPDILEEKISTENYVKCDCDCSKCKMCYSGKISKLAVAIH